MPITKIPIMTPTELTVEIEIVSSEVLRIQLLAKPDAQLFRMCCPVQIYATLGQPNGALCLGDICGELGFWTVGIGAEKSTKSRIGPAAAPGADKFERATRTRLCQSNPGISRLQALVVTIGITEVAIQQVDITNTPRTGCTYQNIPVALDVQGPACSAASPKTIRGSERNIHDMCQWFEETDTEARAFEVTAGSHDLPAYRRQERARLIG
jgi:hypothetical protein